MTATPTGLFPTGTVAVTVLVPVSIKETSLLHKFVTYTFFPSGVTATSRGKWGDSKFTVAVTLFVEVLNYRDSVATSVCNIYKLHCA
jgi:hypothetical protein